MKQAIKLVLTFLALLIVTLTTLTFGWVWVMDNGGFDIYTLIVIGGAIVPIFGFFCLWVSAKVSTFLIEE